MMWRWAGRLLLGVTWLLTFHVVAVHNGRTDETGVEKWLLALCCAAALTMFGIVVERREESRAARSRSYRCPSEFTIGNGETIRCVGKQWDHHSHWGYTDDGRHVVEW